VGQEALARALAYAASMLLLFACVGCVWLCALVISRHVRGRRAIPHAAVGALAVVVGVYFFWPTGGRHVFDFFGGDLFERTVYAQMPCVPWPLNAPGFLALFDGATAAALVASCYVVGAVCAVLGDSSRAGAPGPRHAAERELKLLLLAASSVLVFGVVCAQALNGWPAAFYAPQDAAKKAQFVLALQGYVDLQGTFYSLLLVAMFAPVAFTRLGRALSLDLEDGAAKVWGEIAQQAVALAAPLVAASILGAVGVVSAR